VQRLSNNFRPKFTDEEAITIYLWGILNRKFGEKEGYDFIGDYWAGWFPDLPSYTNYSRRICNLAEVFVQIAALMMATSELSPDEFAYLLDSMPIVVAKGQRIGTATAAGDICDKGYCASKKMWYYGVKLHSLNQWQPSALPTPFIAWVTPASHSDITSAKQHLQNIRNIDVFADKIYRDRNWWRLMLSRNNVSFTAPVKLKKDQKRHDPDVSLYNSLVSAIRQPIDAFFSWLIDKTNIQSASKVRSKNGLLSFVFARLAAAFFIF
jgi:hypothetical protein